MQIFGKFCLRHSNVRTDKRIYKTADGVNTYVDVTCEELF